MCGNFAQGGRTSRESTDTVRQESENQGEESLNHKAAHTSLCVNLAEVLVGDGVDSLVMVASVRV